LFENFGTYCAACHDKTSTSTHGHCLCGYQKHPSKVLEARGKSFKPFAIIEKVKHLEELEEVIKIMRTRPHLSREALK
jgi:hypothetical protein